MYTYLLSYLNVVTVYPSLFPSEMQAASPKNEPSPGHLVYQDDGLCSIRGSTNASLSGGNQATISDEFSFREALSRYLQAGINTEWTDVLLIICGFVSGLVDGLSFNAWGSFSSMQTGASHTRIVSDARTGTEHNTHQLQETPSS